MNKDAIEKTKEMLSKFNITDDDIIENSKQLTYAYLLLLEASSNIRNNKNAMLYNSCGEVLAPDGTHYQVQMMIVPEKDNWVNEQGVYCSIPVEDLTTYNEDSIN